MGFKVDHEQFSLCTARFISPGTVLGARDNPLETLGEALVAEIARTGWDLPGIDVRIDTHGQGTEVLRRVWMVSFATARGELNLFFGNRQQDGSYGLSGAEIEDDLKVWFYHDGRGRQKRADVAFVTQAIEEVTSRLKGIDSALGHDDVTEKGDANLRRLCHVEPVNVPEGFPKLYAWAEPNDTWRLAGRTEDAGTPRGDFGLSGNGWRLVSLGASGGPLHSNGYTYASTDPSVRAAQVIYTAKEECLPVEISLDRLNDVYVVDNAAFEHAREAVWAKAEAEKRERITDAELDACILETAKTIVPWAEYDGSFEKPTVLIGRQTFRNEVRLMRGPVNVGMDGDGVFATMTDTQTGLKMELTRSRHSGIGACRHVTRVAEQAGRALGVRVKASPELTAKLESTPEPSLADLLQR